jgi:hypothetical protein
MSAFFGPPGPARRALAGHLDCLGASLAALGRQLRDSAAGAVGRAAAEAVRQAVACLLRQPGEGHDAHAEAPYRRDCRPLPGRGGPEPPDDCQGPAEPRWAQNASGWRHPDYDEPSQPYQADEASSRPAGGWRAALAAGCRLLAWLLGRLAAPGAALAALAVGAAAALAAYLAGPAAGPGPLLALTDSLAALAHLARG